MDSRFVVVKYGSTGTQLMAMLGMGHNGEFVGYKFSNKSRTFTKGKCRVLPANVLPDDPCKHRSYRFAAEAIAKRTG